MNHPETYEYYFNTYGVGTHQHHNQTLHVKYEHKFHSRHNVVIFMNEIKEFHRLDGQFHRLDGPAIIYRDGTLKWFINDHNVTPDIHQWAKENDIDLDNLSEDDKLLIKLIWADYGK